MPGWSLADARRVLAIEERSGAVVDVRHLLMIEAPAELFLVERGERRHERRVGGSCGFGGAAIATTPWIARRTPTDTAAANELRFMTLPLGPIRDPLCERTVA